MISNEDQIKNKYQGNITHSSFWLNSKEKQATSIIEITAKDVDKKWKIIKPLYSYQQLRRRICKYVKSLLEK